MLRARCSMRSVGLLVALLVITLRGGLAQSGNGLFSTPSIYGSGGQYARSVAVADVDGDGKPDLVVANHCDSGSCQNGTVGVLLGNGDGTFQPAVAYGSGGVSAESVAVADVNRDGKPDLLVANDSAIGVLLGNGDGTFRPAVTYGPGGVSVAVADVNGDGNPDLLVADYTQGVYVLLSNSDGTFQAAVTYRSGGGSALSVAVADVNGDGKPDLLVANDCFSFGNCASGGTVGVLLGNGDGTFRPVVAYGSGGSRAWSVAVADVNGDGKPDLLVANECVDSNCANATGTVGVLLGNGDGTFQAAVPYGSGGYEILWVTMAVADVNGDGKADLLVTNECVDSSCANTNGTVGVLLGNGDGTFKPAMTYGSGGERAWSVAVADVNGDAKPDLLVANEIFGVGVLLNIGTPSSGTISVTANLSTATFAITGPASFSGSGTSATFTNASVGAYTITFGSVPGYIAPKPQTQTLVSGATLVFSGIYVPAAPLINVTPALLDFQSVPIGVSRTLSVAVQNAGNAQLTGAAMAADPFQVVDSSQFVIQPGQSRVILLSFLPVKSGTVASTATFSSNGGSVSVQLGGSGFTVKKIALGEVTTSSGSPLPGIPVLLLNSPDLSRKGVAFTDAAGNYFLTGFSSKDYVMPVSSGTAVDSGNPNVGPHGYIFGPEFCQVDINTAERLCSASGKSVTQNFVASSKPAPLLPIIGFEMPLPSGNWQLVTEAGGYALTRGTVDGDPSHTNLGSGFYALDLAGPCGTPILAPADGQVVIAKNTPDFGNTVVLKHSSGVYTRYAHLHSIAVRLGDQVNQGEVLGLLGSTGLSFGPHLHFQFYDGGRSSATSQSDDALLRQVQVREGSTSLALTEFIAGEIYQSNNVSATRTTTCKK